MFYHNAIRLREREIRLNHEPDNAALAGLFLRVCGVTHLLPAAQVAISRLQAAGLEAEERWRRG